MVYSEAGGKKSKNKIVSQCFFGQIFVISEDF